MRRVVIAGVLVVLAATSGYADQKLDLARAHYKAGAAYYLRGKYRDAIREFEQSYELSRKPEILYNLAQCHDRLAEHPKVIEYLHRYLKAKPNAEDKEQVMAWLENLKKVVAAKEAAQQDAVAARTEGGFFLVYQVDETGAPAGTPLPTHILVYRPQGVL